MSINIPLIVGNWKMNGDLQQAEQLINEITDAHTYLEEGQVETVICPSTVFLHRAWQLIGNSSVRLGAQDVSAYESGAYTGEVSAAMLKDFGCQYVIVGHSERRLHHNESNLIVARKAAKAIESGLIPIICLGENEEERRLNRELGVIDAQIAPILAMWAEKKFAKIVLAYEPVWAIGTGLTATPVQAQLIHSHMRSCLEQCHQGYGRETCLLYGGSVKPDNARLLFEQKDINGGLIGGASLNAGSFLEIIKVAS